MTARTAGLPLWSNGGTRLAGAVKVVAPSSVVKYNSPAVPLAPDEEPPVSCHAATPATMSTRTVIAPAVAPLWLFMLSRSPMFAVAIVQTPAHTNVRRRAGDHARAAGTSEQPTDGLPRRWS